MDQASSEPGRERLTQRGQFVAASARWIALGVGLLAALAVWDRPTTWRSAALVVLALYSGFNLASQLYQRRNPRRRWIKVAHDAADALAVGAGAAASGGLASPVWLLLYPHVAAVSVRAGLAYAMVMGVLDAAIVSLLAWQSPDHPLGAVHGVALLFCAFMGGTTSSHLIAVKNRLFGANSQLEERNAQLSASLRANEAARNEQEVALQLLRASETRYRRLLERIQDGVVIIQDGRVAYANDVFGEMVGEPKEALVGLDFLELLPPEDRADISLRYEKWEQSQAVTGGLELRIQPRNGDGLLASVSAGSVDFEGRRSVIATVRDITVQRRMEQEVKAHAERLSAINEIASAINQKLAIEDICLVVERETRHLLAFDRLSVALLDDEDSSLQLLSVEDGEKRPRPTLSRDDVDWAFRYPVTWCEGGADPAPAHYRELLLDEEARALVTVPLLSKDRIIGSLNVGRVSRTPFSATDLAVLEPVARHIALALDNARLLQAISRRGDEFESLLEIGSAIVARSDLKEVLPLLTRSVNRVMGTRHCLLLVLKGERLCVAAHEGLEPEVLEAFGDLRVGDSLSGWVLQNGTPLAVANMLEDPRLRFGDLVQRYGYRSFLGVPLRRGGESIGTLEVLTRGELRTFGEDEQKLMTAFADQAAVALENARLLEDGKRHLESVVDANRQLEELDRMRRDYLRNVSHEFRTPLTVIKGYAEFLKTAEGPTEDAVKGVMRILVESCDRVIDMVDTLIDVSRIEYARSERALQLHQVDLREVAEGAVESLRSAAERKNIDVAIVLPQEALAMEADRGLLHQVVRKLLENALKYSANSTRVTVRAGWAGHELLLEVEDQGVGIPAEHHRRIFEKFYMVDGGVTRRVGGTGVGLYLVREIVTLHRGTVSVESTPGRGSVFSVRLPTRLGQAQRATVA